MKTITNMLALALAFTITLYAGIVHAHTGHQDVSFMFNHATKTLLVIPKDNQSASAACADSKRLGYAAQVTKVQTTVNNKFIYTICK